MNPDLLGSVGPTLPAYLLFPLAALSVAISLYFSARLKSAPARFVIFAFWSRQMLGLFHAFALKPVALGMTLNGLMTALTFAIGIAVVIRRPLALKPLYPVAIIVVLAIVSTVINGTLGGLLNAISKYGYFVVLTIAVCQSLSDTRGNELILALLGALLIPLVAQDLTVVFHIVKLTEEDNSISYIGGYNQESSFSIIMATVVLCAALCRSPIRWYSILFLLWGAAGVFLANYRTSILAIAPVFAAAIATAIVLAFRREQRGLIALGVALAGTIVFVAAASTVQDRFSDIVSAAASPKSFTERPETFTRQDRRLFSGRLYIWSRYYAAYQESSDVRRTFGAGPEARAPNVLKYAHNTLIAALYEYGPAGPVAIFLLWMSMLGLSLRAPVDERLLLVCAHITFILLNLATMPMWLIEGLLLYSVLCGYTLYRWQQSVTRPVPVARPSWRERHQRWLPSSQSVRVSHD